MAKVGYARVSTAEQHTEAQEDTLRGAGCERVYSDTVSGIAAHRPRLAAAFEHLREGDTLVVVRLDRLGRSLRELIELVERLRGIGVHFVSLTEGFDTSTPAGRMLFHVVGAMAELERSLIVERTRAGLDAARARGRRGGRPRRLSPEQVAAARKLLRDGVSVAQAARILTVPDSTLRGALAAPPARAAVEGEDA